MAADSPAYRTTPPTRLLRSRSCRRERSEPARWGLAEPGTMCRRTRACGCWVSRGPGCCSSEAGAAPRGGVRQIISGEGRSSARGRLHLWRAPGRGGRRRRRPDRGQAPTTPSWRCAAPLPEREPVEERGAATAALSRDLARVRPSVDDAVGVRCGFSCFLIPGAGTGGRTHLRTRTCR